MTDHPRITYTAELETDEFRIDQRLYIIVWEYAENPWSWAQDYACAQAHEDLKYSSIRIGQIEIRQSPCCDSIYALKHADEGVLMGKVYHAPYNMRPEVGMMLSTPGRCTKWNDDGSDMITLW